MEPGLHTFFISYSRSDRLFVDALQEDLISLGYAVWVDRRKLQGGDRFMEEIRQAITIAQAVIVVLSPRAVKSSYVRREIAMAHEQDKRIFTILLKPCPIPQAVKDISWVDFSKSFETGWNELLAAFMKAGLLSSVPITAPPRMIPVIPHLGMWDRWLNLPLVFKCLIALILIVVLLGGSGMAYLKIAGPLQVVRTSPKVFNGHIQEFQLSQDGLIRSGGLRAITKGPDGLLWFAAGASVGQLTPAGAYTGFPIQLGNAEEIYGVSDITAGPGGNLWFTEQDTDDIGRIAPSGVIKEFLLPTNCGATSAVGCSPTSITTGPDGNLWFINTDGNSIGRITPTGAVKVFPLPTGCGTTSAGCDFTRLIGGGITTGPDGNLWFTLFSSVGRITPSGEIKEFPLPSAGCNDAEFGCTPNDITAGSDGNLWFTASSVSGISTGIVGRITPTGNMKEFPLPTGSDPEGITAGPDGNLWFTNDASSSIERMTPAGEVKDFDLPAGSDPYDITTGPDGNLWFTAAFGIGQITSSGSVKEFPLPIGSDPEGITAGPDGNLWFTEAGGNVIGRLTTIGKLEEFVLPAGIGPAGITRGPDGNLWFTEPDSRSIGRITPSGSVKEFPLPVVGIGRDPEGITAGPDGNLWFTEPLGSAIGRITPSGTLKQFPLPARSDPYSPYFPVAPEGITTGPDGNLWFTGFGRFDSFIGRITPTGNIKMFPLYPVSSIVASSCPEGITSGPDGNLWFTAGPSIGRITPAGKVKEFDLPAGDDSSCITLGPDGNLWFTTGSGIGRITPAGKVKEFALPTTCGTAKGGCGPWDITTGPDGNLWFTESLGNRIGQLS